MKPSARFLFLPLLGLAAISPVVIAEVTESGITEPVFKKPEMEKKAAAFLDSLTPELKKKAIYPMDSPERVNWHYIPKERNGVELKELDDAQKKAAMDLLHSGLSEKGTMKAEAIMALEAVLAGIEKNPILRDAGHYHVTVFGTPGDAKGWAWRFEGHHISINMTFGEGKFAVTPTFLGSNPAEVRVEGPHKGDRALAPEEDKGRLLGVALSEAGKPVLFSDKAPNEIITANNRAVKQLEAVGVPASDMTEAQQQILKQLIGEYVDRYRQDLAETEWKRIRDAGLDKIRFGWAGSLKPNEAFYYRIQGPTFLIEAANSQNNANHMHTVWRDFDGDFGRDFLGEHYKDHE